MTTTNLLCIRPCNPTIQQQKMRLTAGDTLQLPSAEVETLFGSGFSNCFIVISIDGEVPEPAPTPASAVESVLKPVIESDDETYVLPFDEKEQWQTVRNYVRELEEQPPVDLGKIRYILKLYDHYPSVVKECERILKELADS